MEPAIMGAPSAGKPWYFRVVGGVALLILLKGAFLLLLFFGGIFVSVANKAHSFYLTTLVAQLCLLCDATARLVSAWAIMNRRDWGRWLYLLWAPISIAGGLQTGGIGWAVGLSLIFYFIFLWILTRPESATWFQNVWRPSRALTIGGGTAYALGLVALLTLGAVTSNQNTTNAILTEAGLDRLPKSATDVKASRWRGLFTGESHATFKATPEEIEIFLRQPGMQNAELKALPLQNTRTPERFSRGPEWFTPSLRSKGRWYDFGKSGAVIVDDVQHVVWIVAIRG